MAVQISNGTTVPHATNYEDLLTKLITFATANGWTLVENTADKTVLRGSGAGTDQIFTAIQKYANGGADAYGWTLNGYTGYSGAGNNFFAQPNAIQPSQVAVNFGTPYLPLWNGSTPYWFIVNPRRIIVVAKVSTTYQMAYLGFYLPFATPTQYPYPLMIGGSSLGTPTPRFSLTTANATMFCFGVSAGNSSAPLAMRMPDGTWFYPSNTRSTRQSTGISPYNNSEYALMRPALNGDYVLTPLEIQRRPVTPPNAADRLGELDGIYHVAGFQNGAENIITIGGVNHLVVPNVFRADAASYTAVKLA